MGAEAPERPAPRRAPQLAARKLRVLEHLAHGDSIRETARALRIGRSTVRDHIEDAGSCFGVRGPAATVLAAVRAGLIAPAPGRALDPDERSVIDLLGEGMSERAAAQSLGRSHGEVRRIVDGLYRRFNVHTHAALVYRGAATGRPDPGAGR